MDTFYVQWSVWSSILFVFTQLLEYGLCTPCYTYDCKSSVPTKCRIFPRWSAETTDCSGTCFSVRNTSKSFVYVSRGCTGLSTTGCRPVIKHKGGTSEEYNYEACFCDGPLCNGGHVNRGFNVALLVVVTGHLVMASLLAEILLVQNLLL